ncbi:ferrochelatase [Saccharopolyspora sp. HNM0986]|uniref:ferrochelatase n=1 Tax=Saccharopolyspora galaxeae TaxID=2781241 RepID=UPI00190A561B|nr:ferrochelatase [Saccharopolyspora sp. HNM0986]MBK0869829.1 ferrochelatase [Saccharopolyspora sp. HNM0986]
MSFDALLFLSFGGPEGPEEVRPFLENVTRGRGVPPERLDEVAEHYHHFGGVSPINRLNREMMAALQDELRAEGRDVPIYWGNRNWHPMIEDTVAQLADDGVRRALVFATSAWGGYSGCKQYHEDIARARESVGQRAPDLVKIRQFFDHPLFIEANADAVRRALAELADPDARLVFTAHSIPLRADHAPGPDGRPEWYSRQVHEAARLVAEAAEVDAYDVVWQSRSGPPQVPWLEPDVVDHIEELHGKGVGSVVLSPIGFVSDHLEVVWDLDNEAAEKAAELGMGFRRAATAGDDPRFAKMIVELLAEHTDEVRPRKLSLMPAAGCGVNGETCAPGCCVPESA